MGRGRLLSLLTICGAVALAVVAIAHPYLDWDSWAYHLPISSFLWDIGGGRSAFELCPRFESLSRGYPVVGEFLQGFFWKVSGWVGAALIPQYVALAGYLVLARRWLGAKPDALLLAFFSCPMLFIHYLAAYEDLLAGALCAIALMLALRLATAESFRLKSWLAAGYIACIAALAGMKYPAYLLASVSLLVLCGVLAAQRRPFLQIAMFFAIGLVAVNLFEIRNYVVFGNPFYPFRVEVAGRTVFDGPWRLWPWFPGYAGEWRPVYFLMSLTELDWIKRGVAAVYSIDSFTGDRPQHFHAARTGGLWSVYIWLQLLVLGMQLFRFGALDRVQRLLIILFVPLFLANAFFPRSHELRLWLYIPLVLNLINVRYLEGKLDAVSVRAGLAALVLASAFIVVQERDFAPKPDRASAFRNAGPTVKELRYEGQLGFMYSRAMTGENVRLTPLRCD